MVLISVGEWISCCLLNRGFRVCWSMDLWMTDITGVSWSVSIVAGPAMSNVTAARETARILYHATYSSSHTIMVVVSWMNGWAVRRHLSHRSLNPDKLRYTHCKNISISTDILWRALVFHNWTECRPSLHYSVDLYGSVKLLKTRHKVSMDVQIFF